MTDSTDNTATRVARISRKLDAFGKGGKVQAGGSYRYTAIEDLLAALAPMMAEEELILTVVDVNDHNLQIIDRGNGKQAYAYSAVFRWVCSAPGHDGIAVVAPAQAYDTSDKAVNKAITASRKYALMTLFNVVTSDEADPDANRPEVMAKKEAAMSRRESVKHLVQEHGPQNVAEAVADHYGIDAPETIKGLRVALDSVYSMKVEQINYIADAMGL